MEPPARMSVNSRRDLGDSFIGRGSHQVSGQSPGNERNGHYERRQEERVERVRSPLRHDEGMDELQKFLDFKPIE